MAIVIFGGGVAGIRGKLAGSIFSANKSGPYIRAWARGSNPQSPDQTVQRRWLATYAQAWQALTQGERDDWDTYAADAAQELTNPLGEAYYTSGFTWFVRINIHRRTLARTPRDTYPTCATPTAPTISALTLTAGASGPNSVTWPALEFGANDDVIIKARVFSSQGRLSATHNFPIIRVGQLPEGTGFTFSSALPNEFGSLIAGQRVIVHVYKQHAHGRRAAPTSITGIVP